MPSLPFARVLLTTALSLGLIATLATPAAAQVAPPPPPPAISSVSPAVVSPSGRITVRGRNFTEVRAVTLAGLSLRFRVKSRRLIEASKRRTELMIPNGHFAKIGSHDCRRCYARLGYPHMELRGDTADYVSYQHV